MSAHVLRAALLISALFPAMALAQAALSVQDADSAHRFARKLCKVDQSTINGDVRFHRFSLYTGPMSLVLRKQRDGTWLASTLKPLQKTCSTQSRSLTQKQASALNAALSDPLLFKRRANPLESDRHCTEFLEMGRGAARRAMAFDYCDDPQLSKLLTAIGEP